MGYQTNYTLTCSNVEVLKELIENDEFDGVFNRFDSKTSEAKTYEIKWYEHEADMRKVSKEHPGVIFTLYGEGEEAGDIWKKYFLNGKMQEARARIVIDDFDSAKLT